MPTCQKEFTLTVTGEPPEPQAWWKLEEVFPVINHPDEVGGLIISASSGSTGVPAKILNGMQMQYFDGITFNSSYGIFSGQPQIRNITGFTWCGWVGYLFDPGTAVFFRYFTDNFGLYLSYDGADLILTLTDYGTDLESIHVPQVLNVGEFHFFRMFYDDADGTVGIQIDNGTIFRSVPSYVIPASAGCSLDGSSNRVGGADARWAIDELAFFQKMLTDAEADHLWNDGDGLTFPYV